MYACYSQLFFIVVILEFFTQYTTIDSFLYYS